MKTINEVEVALPELLETLRNVKLTPELSLIRDFLLPPGFIPVIQLEEDGRKKRSSAAARNWSPKSGEIRIYYDPAPEPLKSVPNLKPERDSSEFHAIKPFATVPRSHEFNSSAEQFVPPSLPSGANEVTSQEVVECCQALATAEKSNRQFIALKWFRDDFLPTIDFPWAKSVQRRQRVVSEAISLGRINARKIPNPKAPQFPTTTINLNRSVPTPGVPPRFQPIVVRGEPVSATLIRDRGNV